MLNLHFLALATLSGPVLADLSWFSDSTCGTGFLGMATFNCGLGCTQFTDLAGAPTTNVHSVDGAGLEPNTQVVLYQSTDCSGDAYAAIGQAYGSSVPDDQCAPSTNDGLGSFQVLVYNGSGGGETCPPGTLTAASTKYPAPTG